MTWEESKLDLQYALEERVGFVIREQARMARAIEDQAAASLADQAHER